MKYFSVLGGILLTCFCVLIYLANIKAYRTNGFDPDLLGATTSAILLEGAKASRGQISDISGISGRIDKLERDMNLQLSNLNQRVTALEAKR